jgi:hypothetical protein
MAGKPPTPPQLIAQAGLAQAQFGGDSRRRSRGTSAPRSCLLPASPSANETVFWWISHLGWLLPHNLSHSEPDGQALAARNSPAAATSSLAGLADPHRMLPDDGQHLAGSCRRDRPEAGIPAAFLAGQSRIAPLCGQSSVGATPGRGGQVACPRGAQRAVDALGAAANDLGWPAPIPCIRNVRLRSTLSYCSATGRHSERSRPCK